MLENYTIQEAPIGDLDQVVKFRMEFLQGLESFASQEELNILTQKTSDYFLRKAQSKELFSWFVLHRRAFAAMGSLLINEMPPSTSCYGGGLEGYLFNVYTLPSFRKRGIATLLTQHIMKAARDRQCQRIWLTYSDSIAQHLYAKLGFQGREDVMELFLKQ